MCIALLAAGCGSAERARTPLAASGSLAEATASAGGAASPAEIEFGAAGEEAAAGGPAGGGTSAGAGGGTSTGRATGGAGPRAGAGPVATASQPTAGSGPGITDEEIRIGFIVPGTEQTEGSFGFSLPEDGDVRAQINVLAAHVNANGGVFGRRVKPFIEFYNIQEATPQKEDIVCTKFTEDYKVFAIVLQAQIHEATRSCYARHNTLMFEPSLFAFDDVSYQRLSPYYWSPSFPAHNVAVRGLIDYLATSTDYFGSGAKLGVMLWDMPTYLREYDTTVLPTLAAHGVRVTESQRVNPQDAGTIQAGLSAGVAKFKRAGVNRVIFVGSAPLAPFFVLTAKSQNYAPRYGLSSFDNMGFFPDYEPAQGQIEDMVGIGFSAAADVDDTQYPFPHPEKPLEQRCVKALRDGGQPRPSRAGAQLALAYCESLMLLQAAAAKVSGPMTPATWTRMADTLGTSFQAINGFGTRYGPKRHYGGTHYRGAKYDRSCSCVVYTTPPRPFAGE